MNNSDYLKKMSIVSFASFIEILGGQPLDRIKINSQLPINKRLTFTQLIKKGPLEFYKGTFISSFHGCFIYIPSIYLLDDVYNSKLSTDSNIDNLTKPLFISLFLTPQVSLFEFIKTQKQLNKKIYNFNSKTLMPSLTATYLRESFYGGGICVLTPYFLKKTDNSFASGCISGAITQFISQPFDSIKTHQEYKKENFINSTISIYKDKGIKGFYNGFTPRFTRGIWTFGSLSFITNKLNEIFIT